MEQEIEYTWGLLMYGVCVRRERPHRVAERPGGRKGRKGGA